MWALTHDSSADHMYEFQFEESEDIIYFQNKKFNDFFISKLSFRVQLKL